MIIPDKYVRYDEELNEDGTYKTTIHFDGYHDDDGFHSRECYIVFPRVEKNMGSIPEEYKLTTGSDKVLYKIIFEEE